MKNNFNTNNTERISWITLMNRNNYIIIAVIFAAGITAAIVNATKYHLDFWEFMLALIIPVLGLAAIVWFGFYQYWKTFNKSYGWSIHTIMKGKHYSTFFRMPWFFSTKRSRIFMFAPECAQATNDDINKLYRIGFGLRPFRWEGEKKWNPAHHFNSIGFGWRGNGIAAIEIFTYTYVEGERKTELITVIPVATPFHFELINKNGLVHYAVVPMELIPIQPVDLMSTHKWPETKHGFKLGFYFGGDAPADQNYQVWEKK